MQVKEIVLEVLHGLRRDTSRSGRPVNSLQHCFQIARVKRGCDCETRLRVKVQCEH